MFDLPFGSFVRTDMSSAAAPYASPGEGGDFDAGHLRTRQWIMRVYYDNRITLT